jgi:serine/threonine protein kinase
MDSLRRIGDGIYSTVYSGWNSNARRREVLKFVRTTLDADSSAAKAALKAALRELLALRALTDASASSQGGGHVVRLWGYFVDQGSIVLRLEHMDADLGQLLALSDDCLPSMDKVAVRIATDIFLGLSFVHAHHIVLRDLKPPNVLLSRVSGRAKLADFGLATPIASATPATPQIANADPYQSREVFTRWYRPIESLLGSRRAEPAGDVWSAGLVVGELLNHGPLFPGISDINQISLIFAAIGTPPSANTCSWPDLNKLPLLLHSPAGTSVPDWSALVPRASGCLLAALQGTLRLLPETRLTADQVLNDLLLPEVSTSSWRLVAKWVHETLQNEHF